jgi:phage/plasmid-associated DNA primase
VLAKQFYFDTLISHRGTLKGLMEGKRVSADVKCEDPVMVQLDGPIIFVSNEHPYSDKFFFF